jgi:hypothetical protein
MGKEKSKLKEDVSRKEKKNPAREAYEQIVHQVSDQWDNLLRNPNFLTSMASSVEQSLNLAGRVHDLVGVSLRTMNIASQDDFKAILRRLDDISEQLAELSERLDERPPSVAAKSPAPRKAAAKTVATRKTKTAPKTTES